MNKAFTPGMYDESGSIHPTEEQSDQFDDLFGDLTTENLSDLSDERTVELMKQLVPVYAEQAEENMKVALEPLTVEQANACLVLHKINAGFCVVFSALAKILQNQIDLKEK